MTEYEKSAQILNDVANSIASTFKEVAERFQEFADAVLEAWGVYVHDIFEDFSKWTMFEKSTTPRQYGLSLIRRKGTDNYIASQGYTRPFQKNLPYQRRCC